MGRTLGDNDAWHSAIPGTPTLTLSVVVSPNSSNLSILSPSQLPILETVSIMSADGRLTTHSPLSRIMRWLWLPDEIIAPQSDGVNSRMVCQPSVMMLSRPCHREEISATGPGSR